MADPEKLFTLEAVFAKHGDALLLHYGKWNDPKWILIDGGDLIVHVFHEPIRAFYNLERLWHQAPRVDLLAWEEEARAE